MQEESSKNINENAYAETANISNKTLFAKMDSAPYQIKKRSQNKIKTILIYSILFRKKITFF